MKKEEFKYKSHDNLTDIRAVRYIPDGEIKGILQIAHGMVEYIDRYDLFARFLCEKGYVVTGNDHLGHGASVTSISNWGYFSENDGYNNVLEDMHELTLLTKNLFPNKPYYLLGHSMGSFFTRYYLCKYSNELNGVVIMGTGQQNKITLSFATFICKVLSIFKGWRYRSRFVNNLALGSYNKKWEPSITHVDWLTKDINIIKAYACEPRCNFVFTLNGYYNLFSLMKEIIRKDNLENMIKDLPVLFVSGQDDPVGNFGKSVELVYKQFKDINMKDVSIKLYKDDRHEILNETDKETVYNDIYSFIQSH